MPIANALKLYLNKAGIDYKVQEHAHAESSMQTAQAAHVSGREVAKGILLKDDGSYLLAVLPSGKHVGVDTLGSMMGGRQLHLADEEEVATIFGDCEPGAVPPLGEPYHLEVALDDSLCDRPEIHFKAGDHHELITVSGGDFQRLLAGAKRGSFAK